jgi:hypothetical protein
MQRIPLFIINTLNAVETSCEVQNLDDCSVPQLLCCVCIIYKRVTDEEAFHTFYLLKKLSQEWPLLNSVTWEQNGDFFTDVVFGSYIIITLGLLIGYLCGELRNGRKMVSQGSM